MIRTEQQYEELNRIKPLHFSPLHPALERSKAPPFRRDVCFAVAHPLRGRTCSAVVARSCSRIAEKPGRGTLDVVEMC